LLLCDFVPFSGFEIRVSSLRLGKTLILKIIIVDDVTLRSKLESAWHRPKSTRFLSRVSILSRDIDIANLSVCLSVRNVPISDENGLTYRHSFFSVYGSLIILVLSAANTFTKFTKLAVALNTGLQVGYKNFAIFCQ